MATNYPAALDNDASLLLAKDLALTTLATALTASATTISLNDATSFPGSGGVIKIDNELIKYTGKSGNDLTGATRSYSGTTASAHSSGAEARLVIAADYHNNLKDAIIALQTRLGANGSMAVIDGVQLRAGVQEEGRASFRFVATAIDQYGTYGVGFRAVMTNTPSSVTLSNVTETNEANLNAAYPKAENVTLYGFRFELRSAGAGDCRSLTKKYVTVGN